MYVHSSSQAFFTFQPISEFSALSPYHRLSPSLIPRKAHSSSSHIYLHLILSLDTISPCRPTTADIQETFILSQPRIWWDMYHDRPTFSLVRWSDEDVDEYRGGLETKDGVHAVSTRSPSLYSPLSLPSFAFQVNRIHPSHPI